MVYSIENAEKDMGHLYLNAMNYRYCHDNFNKEVNNIIKKYSDDNSTSDTFSQDISRLKRLKKKCILHSKDYR